MLASREDVLKIRMFIWPSENGSKMQQKVKALYHSCDVGQGQREGLKER